MKPSEQAQVNFIADCLRKGEQRKEIPHRRYYVYAITENGDVCYIGKGKGKRVLSHFKNSTNQLLGQRIRESRNIYDWYIIDDFESELDCLEREKQLICLLKRYGHRLYNSTYYNSKRKFNKSLKQIYEVFEQFRNFTFPIEMPNDKIIGALERAEIILSMCKKEFHNLEVQPIYRGKPLIELKAVQINCVNYCKILIA